MGTATRVPAGISTVTTSPVLSSTYVVHLPTYSFDDAFAAAVVVVVVDARCAHVHESPSRMCKGGWGSPNSESPTADAIEVLCQRHEKFVWYILVQ